MNFNDGTTKLDLNKSKTAVDAASEDPNVVDGATTEAEKVDNAAMESAQRATNRIHADEQEIPGSTLFTK